MAYRRVVAGIALTLSPLRDTREIYDRARERLVRVYGGSLWTGQFPSSSVELIAERAAVLRFALKYSDEDGSISKASLAGVDSVSASFTKRRRYSTDTPDNVSVECSMESPPSDGLAFAELDGSELSEGGYVGELRLTTGDETSTFGTFSVVVRGLDIYR